MPIAVSPAVDRLLDIAYDEQRVALARDEFLQQLLNHAPLQFARVLKLVHQHVMVADAYFLQDKIGIAAAQGAVQDARCAAEQRAVRFGKVALDDALQRGHQLHFITEGYRQVNRVVERPATMRRIGQRDDQIIDRLRHFGPIACAFLRRCIRLIRQSAERRFALTPIRRKQALADIRYRRFDRCSDAPAAAFVHTFQRQQQLLRFFTQAEDLRRVLSLGSQALAARGDLLRIEDDLAARV